MSSVNTIKRVHPMHTFFSTLLFVKDFKLMANTYIYIMQWCYSNLAEIISFRKIWNICSFYVNLKYRFSNFNNRFSKSWSRFARTSDNRLNNWYCVSGAIHCMNIKLSRSLFSFLQTAPASEVKRNFDFPKFYLVHMANRNYTKTTISLNK